MSHSSRVARKMMLLRLGVVLFLALSVLVLEVYSIGRVGYSAVWNHGRATVSAGSHPIVIAWAIAGI
jgi:hypothetical protein